MALAWALLCAACLREPTFRGRDSGPEDAPGEDGADASTELCAPGLTDTTVTRTGFELRGARVCAPGYRLEFSDSGARFHDQLDIDGTAMMGVGQSCNDERAIGVGLFPALTINGEPQPGLETPALEVVLTGPVVAKIRLNWTAQYTCMGQGVLGRRTTFTMFPDGRITRYDHVMQTEQVNSGNCTPCAGGGDGPFFLTSYATIAADDQGTQILGADLGLLGSYGATIPTVPGSPGPQTVCISTRMRQIAFAWTSPTTRIRRVSETPRNIAFVYDFDAGASMVGPDLDDFVTTTMLVGSNAQCSTLRAQVMPYTAPLGLGLLVNGVPIGPTPDGIYGGETLSDVDGQTQALDPPVGPVTLARDTTDIPGGYAVWLDFAAQAAEDPQVTHSGTPQGTWFRRQRVTSSQWLFWFRDPLTAGQTITITPQ